MRLDRLKSEYVYTVVPGQEAKHCHSFEAIMGVMDGIPKTKLSMPKLSITFKGLPLQTVELKPGETGIGRDTSNTICIDSLAVADFHADIRSGPEGYVIRPLQAGYPITVNKHSVTEHLLADGDHILIGKHSLYFTEERTADGFGDSVETRPVAPFRPFEGSFQVMNGKQIGMVIPLRATVTQIGKESTGMVIVTRGSEGYVIAAGSDNVRVTINGQALKNRESALSDGDIVRINSSLLQFFQR